MGWIRRTWWARRRGKYRCGHTASVNPPEPAHRNRPPLGGVVITLAGVIAMVAVIFLVDPLHDAVAAALHGNAGEVKTELDRLGDANVLIIFAMTLIHAVIWYPAELVDAVAGFLYGFWPALGLVMVGWVISAQIAYAIGHAAARPLLHRMIGKERFERTEKMIENGGVTLLLTVRLIPIVPFSLASLAAGTARVPLWTFTWTTAVGYIPITAISVYLGTRLEDFSPTDPRIIGSLAAFLVLILLAHRFIPRSSETDASKTDQESSNLSR